MDRGFDIYAPLHCTRVLWSGVEIIANSVIPVGWRRSRGTGTDRRRARRGRAEPPKLRAYVRLLILTAARQIS